MDRERLIRTLQGQLEGEAFAGAKWLPIGAIGDAGEPKKKEKQHEVSVVKGQSQSRVEEKRRRLAAVAAKIANCPHCPLKKTRLNVVPGEGNPDARIVFVGEAPGATEDQQGRPFVGRAGKLLSDILEAMGLKREQVFICNILKCRPPENRDPLPDEIAECIGYLHEQLEIIEPEIIVALGAHAARTLLNCTSPIGELRGRFHEYIPGPMAKPVKLLATYHPAYLLRNYSKENRLRVWQDMQKVLKELGLSIPGKK